MKQEAVETDMQAAVEPVEGRPDYRNRAVVQNTAAREAIAAVSNRRHWLGRSFGAGQEGVEADWVGQRRR